MQYFVIVYDRGRGKSRIEATYPATERSEAMRQRFRLETLNEGRPELEVVVLGAESEHALRRTHARYFKSTQGLLTQIAEA